MKKRLIFPTSLFAQAHQDRVARPRWWHLCSSVAASLVLLVWSYWVGRMGVSVWQGHAFFYKGHEYTGGQAPLLSWMLMFGSVALAIFSVWTALQYAFEAWWRVRRWHGAPMWPVDSICLLSSRPVPNAVWQASAQSCVQTAPSLSRGRRYFLRTFGVLLVLLGGYLGFLLVSTQAMAPGMVAIVLALCVGGGLMIFKPEVFRD
jgi:hypothetical protein